MKIYCWDYTSQEDIPKEFRNNAIRFIKDTPTGPKVNCGYCGGIFKLVNGLEDCPHCGRDIVYGRYDW